MAAVTIPKAACEGNLQPNISFSGLATKATGQRIHYIENIFDKDGPSLYFRRL